VKAEQTIMCGICGIYNFEKEALVNEETIVRMRDVMKYRGPDDCGLYVKGNIGLGHRRLSIIDIETGHQPMFNQDASIVIVFNGEIYNYIELRENYLKDHTFKTRSDTEVLLHLYEEFGIECLKFLNGIFAFVLYDTGKGKVFLVRDHFGVKPLYYSRRDSGLVFASEIKAILEAGIKPVLNEAMVVEYLTFQYYLGEETLLKDIYRLEPGHYVELEGRTFKKHCYWDINCEEDKSLNEAVCQEEIRNLLNDSVRLQLRSDVPLGCHLSGGIDTGIVAALASRQTLNGRLKTFTASFSKEGGIYDDSAFAKKTSRHINSEMYKLDLNEDDFFNSLEKIFYHLDEPCAGEGVVPQYYVSQIASENVKVVLGGQGADEMFGGYVRHYILYLSYLFDCMLSGKKNNPEDLELSELLYELPQLRNYQPLFYSTLTLTAGKSLNDKYFFLIDRLKDSGGILSGQLTRKTESYCPKSRMNGVLNRSSSTSILNKILYYEMKVWLTALLNVEDKTSMRWSIESRVPLLDYRLCEFAFKVPAKIKFKNGRLKYILKKAMEHVLTPEICQRRDKVGFPVPLFKWNPRLNEYLRHLLETCEYSEYVFNDRFLKSLAGEVAEFNRLTWGLISILNWFKIFKPSIE
jgi:asparagine synthase (glutamine-hydrolysing)